MLVRRSPRPLSRSPGPGRCGGPDARRPEPRKRILGPRLPVRGPCGPRGDSASRGQPETGECGAPVPPAGWPWRGRGPSGGRSLRPRVSGCRRWVGLAGARPPAAAARPPSASPRPGGQEADEAGPRRPTASRGRRLRARPPSRPGRVARAPPRAQRDCDAFAAAAHGRALRPEAARLFVCLFARLLACLLFGFLPRTGCPGRRGRVAPPSTCGAAPPERVPDTRAAPRARRSRPAGCGARLRVTFSQAAPRAPRPYLTVRKRRREWPSGRGGSDLEPQLALSSRTQFSNSQGNQRMLLTRPWHVC